MPFQLVPKTTLDELGRTNDATFRAHCEKLNEDRPILSAGKMWPRDSTYRRHKVHADICGGAVVRGPQTLRGSQNQRFLEISVAISS